MFHQYVPESIPVSQQVSQARNIWEKEDWKLLQMTRNMTLSFILMLEIFFINAFKWHNQMITMHLYKKLEQESLIQCHINTVPQWWQHFIRYCHHQHRYVVYEIKFQTLWWLGLITQIKATPNPIWSLVKRSLLIDLFRHKRIQQMGRMSS